MTFMTTSHSPNAINEAGGHAFMINTDNPQLN